MFKPFTLVCSPAAGASQRFMKGASAAQGDKRYHSSYDEPYLHDAEAFRGLNNGQYHYIRRSLLTCGSKAG